MFNVSIRETQTYITEEETRAVAKNPLFLFSILLISAAFFICFHLPLICCWIKGEQGLLLLWESGAGLAGKLDQTGRSEGAICTISPLS